MTDTRNVEARQLTSNEIEQVSGGFISLAISTMIQSLGSSLQTAARKG